MEGDPNISRVACRWFSGPVVRSVGLVGQSVYWLDRCGTDRMGREAKKGGERRREKGRERVVRPGLSKARKRQGEVGVFFLSRRADFRYDNLHFLV